MLLMLSSLALKDGVLTPGFDYVRGVLSQTMDASSSSDDEWVRRMINLFSETKVSNNTEKNLSVSSSNTPISVKWWLGSLSPGLCFLIGTQGLSPLWAFPGVFHCQHGSFFTSSHCEMPERRRGRPQKWMSVAVLPCQRNLGLLSLRLLESQVTTTMRLAKLCPSLGRKLQLCLSKKITFHQGRARLGRIFGYVYLVCLLLNAAEATLDDLGSRLVASMLSDMLEYVLLFLLWDDPGSLLLFR